MLINAVIVHVHWNTKFQLFMKKKGLVRQILKETENHDSQDTHVRFFLNEKEVRLKQVIINQNW